MKTKFPSWMTSLGKVYKVQGDALFTEVPLSGFEKTMDSLRSHKITVCNAITGYDNGNDYEILYHFVHAGLVLTVKFKISRDSPKIPSIVKDFPSAHLFELETHEMLGVEFMGNRNMRSVMLSSGAPQTPLRKPDITEPIPEDPPGPGQKPAPRTVPAKTENAKPRPKGGRK